MFITLTKYKIRSQFKKYNSKYNKIASALLTNTDLLKMVAQEKKHCFISTGMSTLDEIDAAVKIFRDNDCSFELMHCTSTYPMDLNEANLGCIDTLKNKFNCDVGYSGHEVPSYICCIVAATLGATSIERHITLDRSMYGSDQPASLEEKGLERMVRDVRRVETVLGDGIKRVFDSELPIKEKLRTQN